MAIAVGVIGAVVAVVFGLMDLLTIPRGTQAQKTGLTHMALNLAVVAVFAISFFMRSGDEATSVGLVMLSAHVLPAFSASGWLGGTHAG